MARYRSKDDVDLAWNKLRRRLTRELDTQIADVREEMLNTILTDAWTHFAKSLEKGEVPKLESHYVQFVSEALREIIDVTPSIHTPEAA